MIKKILIGIVTAGMILITIPTVNAEDEITLNEGDSIFFDSSHRHAMVALNDEKAKFLAIIM